MSFHMLFLSLFRIIWFLIFSQLRLESIDFQRFLTITIGAKLDIKYGIHLVILISEYVAKLRHEYTSRCSKSMNNGLKGMNDGLKGMNDIHTDVCIRI
jgi:hypothetical protein